MTTLVNRPNTALLVVDVQNGVVEGAHARDAVVANVGSLVEKARERGQLRRYALKPDPHKRTLPNANCLPELDAEAITRRVA